MKNMTDITVLLDRSGSMQSIKNDMEGAFDNLVKEQAANKIDECTLSLYQFDTDCDKVYLGTAIDRVPALNIRPRGATALLDAMEQVINETGARLAALPENDRPARVVFVVITDGEENSSVKCNEGKLKEIVNRQTTAYNWQFVYLGANQDAFSVASKIGVNINNTTNYTADSIGITSSYSSVSSNLMSFRSCTTESMAFTPEQQTAAASTITKMTAEEADAIRPDYKSTCKPCNSWRDKANKFFKR